MQRFMEAVHHQENHLGRSFGDGGVCGGDGGLRPIIGSSGGANEEERNIYRDNISFSGKNFARDSTNLQPFHIFPSTYAYNTYPGGGMATTSVGFPFTYAQWKELERQAMIFKYMISSVPVPRDLLFPLSTNFLGAAVDSSASFDTVRYSKNRDPEVGRCKRTDGKKWRCSREVEPHQRYCERHLHRSRPRSRKPVEVEISGENHKKSRLEENHLPKSSSTYSQQLFAASAPLLQFSTETDPSIATAPSFKGNNGNMGLMMGGIDNQLQHLKESQNELINEGPSVYEPNASIFHCDYMEHQPLNLYSYSKFPDSVTEAPVGFIDAWSIENINKNNNENYGGASVSRNHGNLPSDLYLSMAMAAGEILDGEMDRVQVQFESKDTDEDQKAKDFPSLIPVSWEPFSQGGPLAEALLLGSVPIGSSNAASPYNSFGSAPGTTVSSPSGVLYKTPFSQSDSSVCNSPTSGLMM